MNQRSKFARLSESLLENDIDSGDDDDIIDEILTVVMPIISGDLVQTKTRKRKCWESEFVQNRPIGFHAVNFPTLLRDEARFLNYFRMTPTQFEFIINLIGPLIECRRTTVARKPISVAERLAVTLRYLASGDSQISMAFQYNLGVSTVSQIVTTVCAAIWNKLQPIVLPPPTTEDLKKIGYGFGEMWQFPHCIGAIDGRHVHIQAPANAGSQFFNYKNYHSVVVLAICDHQYQFIMVDIGANGRQSDGGIFSRSIMGKKFENGTMGVPEPELVEGSQDTVLPFVLVGDQAFALSSYLQRPYPDQNNITVEQRIFNYRLSRARRISENSFGIWTSRWRILREPIVANEETIENICKATICLHNFLMQGKSRNRNLYFDPTLVDRESQNGTIIPGSWRNEQVEHTHVFNNTINMSSSTLGKIYQQQFTEYFEHEGAVSWQWDRINQ